MTRNAFGPLAGLMALAMVVAAANRSFLTAAPAAKPVEVPRVVMKNLRMEGQEAGKGPIELPRKKFLPIDANLEAGTWGFSRTPCFQLTYVGKEGELSSTFPEQIFTHPVVETDPCLIFTACLFRGDQLSAETVVTAMPALFGNEVKPWEAKVRYWITTPDQPGEYTLDFTVCDQEAVKKGQAEIVKLARQKIVIR